jgi:putative transposase
MASYLKHEGYAWNRKRIRRIYHELRLNLRVKPNKRLPNRTPQPLSQPKHANRSWTLDFMSDSLASGQASGTLNVFEVSTGRSNGSNWTFLLLRSMRSVFWII